MLCSSLILVVSLHCLWLYKYVHKIYTFLLYIWCIYEYCTMYVCKYIHNTYTHNFTCQLFYMPYLQHWLSHSKSVMCNFQVTGSKEEIVCLPLHLFLCSYKMKLRLGPSWPNAEKSNILGNGLVTRSVGEAPRNAHPWTFHWERNKIPFCLSD